MNSIQQSNGNIVRVSGNRVWINGEEMPATPTKGDAHNTTQVNDKVYIDGYEFKNGKWRRTLAALWHLWF